MMLRLYYDKKEKIYIYADKRKCDTCHLSPREFVLLSVNWDEYNHPFYSVYCEECYKRFRKENIKTGHNINMNFIAFVGTPSLYSEPYIPIKPTLSNVKGDLSVFEAHKLKSEGIDDTSKIKYATFVPRNDKQLEGGYTEKIDIQREEELNEVLNDDRLEQFFDQLQSTEAIEHKQNKLLEVDKNG